jgi:predicted 3-demethylubiquinone-9 3-methyltransferase (glyoxalase superfamily)
MRQVQTLHQQAMDLAEAAAVARLRGMTEEADKLTRQAFEHEAQAAALIVNNVDAEPTRSVLHRSAASLAIECGDFKEADRLIFSALSGNPPLEIAEELKDLFIQINLSQYLKRHGIQINNNELQEMIK